MKVLGIESSCDETAAAVVEDGCRLFSNVVASSMDLHAQYGGVIPEIAARSHIECINAVVSQALAEADCSWHDIDAIAVTYGAGLGGSLLIGVLAAHTLAIAHGKPLYHCNHVEGHVYANFLTELSQTAAKTGSPLANYQLPSSQPVFPLLALIVSGGHSQLVLFRGHFDYTLLGQTHDDAIGEAYDKVAKILGLPYPGGPSIGQKAKEGNAFAYDLPKAKMTTISPELAALRASKNHELGLMNQEKTQNNQKPLEDNSTNGSAAKSPQSSFTIHHSAGAAGFSYDFSFSGLKTAVLRLAQTISGHDHTFASKDLPQALTEAQKADIAASFERIATETVVDKAVQAFEEFAPKAVIIAGGVAASPELRRQLSERIPITIQYTDRRLCTDNGAMIAALGCFHMKHNHQPTDPYRAIIKPNLSM